MTVTSYSRHVGVHVLDLTREGREHGHVRAGGVHGCA